MSVWKTIEYPVKSHWVSGIGHKEDEPKKSCQFIAFLLKCHDPFEEPFNRICIHLLSVFDFFFVIRNSNAKLGEQTNPSTIKPIYSQYIIMAIKYMLLRKCVWGFSSLPVAIYSPMQAQLARIIFRLFYLCRIAYDSNLPPVNHLVLYVSWCSELHESVPYSCFWALNSISSCLTTISSNIAHFG